MKGQSREIQGRDLRIMAIVETTSSLDDIRAALVDEPGASYFECVRSPPFSADSGRYNLLVDSIDPQAALAKTRSLLGQLSDASDRGMLEHFHIVQGADVLLRHANVVAYSNSQSAEFDETARAAQPDPGRIRSHDQR